MKIAISGNAYALADMVEIQEELEALGHKVTLAFEYVFQMEKERSEKKKQKDRLTFFEKIKKSDALLVINNFQKENRRRHISGCSFLEMGFAHALGKKIFLLQDVSDISYRDEILALKPVILNGNFKKIK